MNGSIVFKHIVVRRFVFLMVSVYLLLFLFDFIDLDCPFITYLNFYCPMCQSTRSFRFLLQGQLLDSFKLNPLLLFWIYLCLITYVDFAIVTLFQNKDSKIDFVKKTHPLLSSRLFFQNKRHQFIAGFLITINIVYLNYFF